jgi:hypothetical protein
VSALTHDLSQFHKHITEMETQWCAPQSYMRLETTPIDSSAEVRVVASLEASDDDDEWHTKKFGETIAKIETFLDCLSALSFEFVHICTHLEMHQAMLHPETVLDFQPGMFSDEMSTTKSRIIALLSHTQSAVTDSIDRLECMSAMRNRHDLFFAKWDHLKNSDRTGMLTEERDGVVKITQKHLTASLRRTMHESLSQMQITTLTMWSIAYHGIVPKVSMTRTGQRSSHHSSMIR